MATPRSDWKVLAEPPSLTPPQAHFWRVHVAGMNAIPCVSWLDADERAVGARFHRAADRTRFTAGRCALKHLLSCYLGTTPRALRLEKGVHGKPFLADVDDLHFNLSHSGDWVVIGVAAGAAIGVDIEAVTPNSDVSNLSKICFSPQERRWVASEPEERKLAAFYRAWTRKEAYLKMLGSGLVDGLHNIDCLLKTPHAMEVATLDTQRAQVSVHEAYPAEGYVATLVTDKLGRVVNCWTFDSAAFERS